MVTLLDLLYAAAFAVVFPLWDYLVSWKSFRRQVEADPARARKRIWTTAILFAWPVVGVGMGLWLFHNRSWQELGLGLPQGWRLWVAIGLVLIMALYLVRATASVVGDPKVRETVRQQAENVADLMPRKRAELFWFGAVSVTAGFCEEFLFRGFLIWALAPWLGWWGGAGVSVMIFGLGHAYQGTGGVIRTGVMGVLFTLIVALTGSLWPAILIHSMWDLSMGVIAWLALGDGTVSETRA